jgi:hypothetical protein
MSRAVAEILVAVFALPATATAHHKAPRCKPTAGAGRAARPARVAVLDGV